MSKRQTNQRTLQKLRFNGKAISTRAKKAERESLRHAQKFVVRRWQRVREVRRSVIIWAVTIGLLIAMTGVQVLWYRNGYMTSSPAKDGVYSEAVLGPLKTLNPLFASSSAEQSASRLLFSSLLAYDTTGHLNNDLASKVSVSDSGKTYDVTVRSGVLWQDKTPLTADDVVFTANLIKNPDTQSTINGLDKVQVSKLNSQTVRFQLPASYAAFQHVLTFPIVPEHILKNVSPSGLRESNFANAPIGSGPFGFEYTQTSPAQSSGAIIHLTRNEQYYQGAPLLSKLQLHVYNSRGDIVQAVKNGDVVGAADLNYDDTVKLASSDYTVRGNDIASGVYALFNTERPQLKDATVRQALRAATDVTALRSQVGGGVDRLDLPFTRSQLNNRTIAVPGYDLKTANALLDKAGWKLVKGVRTKDSRPLKLEIVTVKEGSYQRALAALTDQWKKVGVQVDSQVIDTSDVTQNIIQSVLQPRSYDVLLYQLSLGADPDEYAYWHSSQIGTDGFNLSNYENPVVDDALTTARLNLNPQLRQAKYELVAKQWLRDTPAIGLFQSRSYYVVNKHVQVFNPANQFVTATDRYSDVQYWSVGQRSVYKTP